MKKTLFILFFYNLANAEVLNGLPAHPPVANPRLRLDDMGSFHDPRGSCIRKKVRRRTYRTHCFGRLHQGIDVISLTNNKYVFAVRGGRVVYRGRLTPGLGYTVIVKHDDNYYVLYAHLDRSIMKLRVGQQVARGEQIGNTGASGNAHRSPYPYQVHIEVIKAPYFKYRGVKTLKWLKQLGKRAYADGGVVSPHAINSFQSVIPGLSDFHECPEGEMHCTCPEYHDDKWCHEFDKDLRCPL